MQMVDLMVMMMILRIMIVFVIVRTEFEEMWKGREQE